MYAAYTTSEAKHIAYYSKIGFLIGHTGTAKYLSIYAHFASTQIG